jgi:hypothetical protein
MSDPKADLFGKIDALLGRRIPDALLDKGLDIEDFPLLTEVVNECDEDVGGNQPERRRVERRELDRRLGDRRQDGRRAADLQAEPPPPLPADMGEMARLVAAMEQRLVDMFIRQQLRMEEAVRKAIRDEMTRPGEDGH